MQMPLVLNFRVSGKGQSAPGLSSRGPYVVQYQREISVMSRQHILSDGRHDRVNSLDTNQIDVDRIHLSPDDRITSLQTMIGQSPDAIVGQGREESAWYLSGISFGASE